MEDQEPYARAMKDKPAPYNAWGQRIVNLTNYQRGLFVATMNKQGSPWLPEVHDFLDEATVAQYGAIYRLNIPSQIAAPFTWREQTTLRFQVRGGEMTIEQDGREIGWARVPVLDHLDASTADPIRVGDGIYGPSTGKVVVVSATVSNP